MSALVDEYICLTRMSAVVDRGAWAALRASDAERFDSYCVDLFFASSTRHSKEYVLSRRTWVACALFAPREESRPSS